MVFSKKRRLQQEAAKQAAFQWVLMNLAMKDRNMRTHAEASPSLNDAMKRLWEAHHVGPYPIPSVEAERPRIVDWDAVAHSTRAFLNGTPIHNG